MTFETAPAVPERRERIGMSFGTAVVILVAAIVLAAGMVGGVLLLARRLVGQGAAAPPPAPGPDPALAAAQQDQRAEIARLEERLIAREEKLEQRTRDMADR